MESECSAFETVIGSGCTGTDQGQIESGSGQLSGVSWLVSWLVGQSLLCSWYVPLIRWTGISERTVGELVRRRASG